MKNNSLRYILAAVILFVAAVSLPAIAQEKPMKIGYVDLKRVYEESGKKTLYDEKMKDAEREEGMKINRIEEDINSYKKMLLEVGEEQRREYQDKIIQKAQELKSAQMAAQRTLQMKSREFEVEFAKELKEIMTGIGEKEGYTYILSDLVILYSDDAHDLTEKAIQAFKKNAGKSTESKKGD